MNFLQKKKILLVVTGGIASYKSLDLIENYKKKCQIECILTRNALEFVKLITFESLLGKKIVQIFPLDQKKMNHINLANTCDAILIVPLQQTMFKIASGVADDLATSVILAKQDESDSTCYELKYVGKCSCKKSKNSN